MKCTPTDGELLMQFVQHKDDAAFETLVNRHQAAVYGVCHRVLGNFHDAEDAFQATFLVLARKAHRFQTSASMGGWLFRVAVRTAKNVQVKRWRAHEEALHAPLITASSDPLAIIQEKEIVSTLYEELERLPEKYQTPIVLCILEGKSRTQASAELDCTLASLKARLARGRRQLRLRLTRRGISFSVALTAASSLGTVADAAMTSLCSSTATTCSSYLFAAKGCGISPEVIQLSEKGLSTMTLATYSKLAIASVLLLTIGVGSVALPIPGPSQVHAVDGAIDIDLQPAKATQRTTAFTPARRQGTATTQQNPSVAPVGASQLTVGHFSSNVAPGIQNPFTYVTRAQSSVPKSTVSEQASSEVVQALIEALGDSEQQVTHNAAKTLISIGGGRSEVVEAFAELAAKAQDEKLRYYAVAGLGRIGGKDPIAVRTLIAILGRDSDAVFRKAAVKALGQVQMNDEVAKTLATALKDSDAKVRVAAAKVLGRLNPSHNSVLRPRVSLPADLQPENSTSFVVPRRR